MKATLAWSMWRPVLEPSSSHQRAKAPGKMGQGWMELKIERIMKVLPITLSMWLLKASLVSAGPGA